MSDDQATQRIEAMEGRDPRIDPHYRDLLRKGKEVRRVYRLSANAVKYDRPFGAELTTVALLDWRKWAKRAEVVRRHDQ